MTADDPHAGSGATPERDAPFAKPSARARWGALAPNVQGAAWLVISAVASASMLIAAKGLGDHIHTFQITFIRAAASCVLALPLLRGMTWTRLKPQRPLLIITRSALATATISLLFFSVSRIPLADAQALNFASVVFVIPLSVVFLGERVGINRWAAVIIGFLGVLVVLRPTGAVNIGAVAGVLGAAVYALMLINVRFLSRSMDANALYVWGIGLLAAFSLPLALTVWTPPSGQDWPILGAVGVFGALSQYAAVRAYAIGEASAIAPVDYLKLVFAILGGVIVFQEFPDAWTIVGAALIVIATAYAAYREAQRGAQARTARNAGSVSGPTDP